MSILNSYNWFSNPTDFNDPFDCQIDLECREIPFDEYMKHYVLAKYGETLKEGVMYEHSFPVDAIVDGHFTSSFRELMIDFRKHVQEEVRRGGVLSLSGKFDNTTMWSHYADNHQGICIEYEPALFNGAQDIHKICSKVNYMDKKDISFNIYELYAKCSNNQNKNQFDKLLKELALTKSDDWKYEEEWRLFHKNKGIMRYSDLAIKGIYFGLNCGLEEKRAIRNILGNKLMSFFQMVKSPHGLYLESHPMSKNSKYWSTSPF